jgi:PAS domain S-box-containing protein
MTIVPKQLMSILFQNPNEDEQEPEVDIEVFDGTEVNTNKLLYDSDGHFHAGNPKNHFTLTRQITMPILNRQWAIFFETTPEFDANSNTRYLQWLALFGGLTVSALLFGITWVQVNARFQAEHDAVELKHSETALAAKKELLDVTLNSIAEGVITTDTSGKITSTNKAVESLTGWLQNEVEGKSLGEIFHLVHEDTHEPCPNPVDKVFQTRAPVEVENHILLVARDGTERGVAAGAAPIRDDDGGLMGAVLVFRDVTEKLKAEAQMLTESKLKSVGLLAGGIAHDFNNMLTAMIGNLSLARLPGSSREEILESLADAEKSALGAKDLTQQLLTFAKGGAPVKKPTLLHELIRKACQFALRGSNVQCDYSLASDIWPVEVDEGQIRQILNNLVINARQAMPQGGKMELRMENAELSANAMPQLPAGKYVKLSIKDNGPGILPEHLSRVFEPYFTTKKTGTGLGLATVYSIIQKHDGQIKVVSQPGKGTTFEIYLPASQQPVAPPCVEPKPESLSGHGRILVVDDEAPIRKLLSIMLRKFGYETETANDGVEGIERYVTAKSGGAPFDAVIMDLTVPNGMGGCEATRRLRELDPDARVIASSGYSLDPVMANYRDYGFCGVVPKPYRPEELNRVLKEIILAN